MLLTRPQLLQPQRPHRDRQADHCQHRGRCRGRGHHRRLNGADVERDGKGASGRSDIPRPGPDVDRGSADSRIKKCGVDLQLLVNIITLTVNPSIRVARKTKKRIQTWFRNSDLLRELFCVTHMRCLTCLFLYFSCLTTTMPRFLSSLSSHIKLGLGCMASEEVSLFGWSRLLDTMVLPIALTASSQVDHGNDSNKIRSSQQEKVNNHRTDTRPRLIRIVWYRYSRAIIYGHLFSH